MSSSDFNFDWRGRAIRAVRRQARLIEAQLHRLYASLARLEADHEDDVADYLSGDREPIGNSSDTWRHDRQQAPCYRGRGSNHVEQEGEAPRTALSDFAISVDGTLASGIEAPEPGISPGVNAAPSIVPVGSVDQEAKAPTMKRSRSSTRPWLLSLLVHASLVMACLPLTYATLTNQPALLFASPNEKFDELEEEIASIKIEEAVASDVEMRHLTIETAGVRLSDRLTEKLAPLDSLAAVEATKSLGGFDAIATDLGTLMAGAGDPGAGQADGPPGSAIFFGTKSHGNRFVFVVDNSSSMKGGRLEAAIQELVTSVSAMTHRQSFYVIFVSDQTYAMFYPTPASSLVPATSDNKRRLGEWLTRVELAPGKNRELIKAMDLAASLRPDAVFLLWDGDLRYSEKVRNDVMVHLTRPQPRSFRIHTLGMGALSRDSEFNLSAIAQANGGTYRRINVPSSANRK